MDSVNSALLVNLVGFTVGIALYFMLTAMVVQHRGGRLNKLLLTAGLLGMAWNVGEFFVLMQKDAGGHAPWPFVSAFAYSALGFLPPIVVHSARGDGRCPLWLVLAAYALSSAAALLHFLSAAGGTAVPSEPALQALTIAAIVLIGGLLASNWRQALDKKSVWGSALLIFAASSLHLSGGSAENSWVIEAAAHQSSLPLAIAILIQNYRFAFADLFLKRAISLLMLAGLAVSLYVLIAAPVLALHEGHGRNDVQAITVIITLWIATALVYPRLHRIADAVVDRLILHRADYTAVQAELARRLAASDSSEQMLHIVSQKLAATLAADLSEWSEARIAEGAGTPNVSIEHSSVSMFIPTAEAPRYKIHLADFRGGRRLLSDDAAMLEAVAVQTARSIDLLRVRHERCERELREQEFSRLAAEARLTALRAQINPHFLFNALTTIGYLIQTTPDKALQTLLQLNRLLRGVLSRPAEFCRLGDELALIESYLEIERARFEEKLATEIDVPEVLAEQRVPALILQPLVENAIKHAVSENRSGGMVRISARLEDGSLVLRVSDSGPGTAVSPDAGTEGGVGLQNIRGRLRSYYGSGGRLSLKENPGGGMTAEIRIGLSISEPSMADVNR
jgi:LytS/YehU family sensor histidine kinase